MKLVIEFLLGAGLPPALTMAWRPVSMLMTRWMMHRTYTKRDFVADWIWSASFQVFLWQVSHMTAVAIGSGVSAVIAVLLWWWRRKPDRAANLIGEKSRARLAAVVRKAREAAQPRPVLQPQRQAS